MERFKTLSQTGLLIIMIVFLTACSNNSGSINKNANNNTLDGGETVSTSNNSTDGKGKETKISTEIMDADTYSSLVQIGNNVISMPTDYSTLINIGATLAEAEISEDFLMDALSEKNINMVFNNTIIEIRIKNELNERAPLKNSKINKITKTNGPDVIYPKGIQVGSGLQVLIDSWGEPSLDSSKSYGNEIVYKYMEYPINPEIISSLSSTLDLMSATGYHYTVTVDRNTSKITNIQCAWVEKPSIDKYETFTKDVRYGQDQFILTYQIPSYLCQNMLSAGGKCVNILLIDGIPYVLIIDGNLSGFGTPKNYEITDENLISEINNGYSIDQYDVEIVAKSDTEGAICGYLMKENTLLGTSVYTNGQHKYTSSESKIIPYDENGELSEAAIKEFKQIITTFTKSVHEE